MFVIQLCILVVFMPRFMHVLNKGFCNAKFWHLEASGGVKYIWIKKAHHWLIPHIVSIVSTDPIMS